MKPINLTNTSIESYHFPMTDNANKTIKLEQFFYKMLQFILPIYFYYDAGKCKSYVMPRYVTYMWIYNKSIVTIVTEQAKAYKCQY